MALIPVPADVSDGPAPRPAAVTRAHAGKTFTAETAPRWVVAATTPAAVSSLSADRPKRNWRPDKRWSVAPTVGTDGIGGELSFLATRSLVLRARGSWLGVRQGKTYDGVHYSGRFKYAVGGAFLDVHPAPGWLHPFLLSGGVVTGQRQVSILATPKGSVTYGGHTYTGAEIGTVSGSIRLPETAPYLGVGWDNSFDTTSPLAFKFLAGAAFSGSPSVELTSTGGALSATPMVQADIAAEKDRIRRASDYLRIYPMVSTGLSLKF